MNPAIPSESIRCVDLDPRQLLVFTDRPGTRIRVLRGRVWLTEQGQLDDQVAGPGEELHLARRGRAVLESLVSSRLCLTEPALRGVSRLQAWLAMLRRDARAAMPRALARLFSLVLAVGLSEMLARGFQATAA